MAQCMEYQEREVASQSGLQVRFLFYSHYRVLISISGDRIGIYGSLFYNRWAECTYILDEREPVVTMHNLTDAHIRSYGSAVYTVPLYESPVLEYGPHFLNVTLNRQWVGSNPIVIDYPYVLDFITIGTKDEGDSNMFIVDDADPAVEYNGFLPEELPEGLEYRHTLNWSNSTGSSAIFKFNGSAIQVYGSMQNSVEDHTRMILFKIDSGENATFYSTNTGEIPAPKQLFYSKDGLSGGPHTLYIESLNSLRYSIDYIIYNSSNSSITFSSPSISPSHSPNIPTAAIAGGVVGSVAGLALFILLFIIYRQRKTDSEETDGNIQRYPMASAASSISPLVIASNPSSGDSTSRNDMVQTSTGEDFHPSSQDPDLPPWSPRRETNDDRVAQIQTRLRLLLPPDAPTGLRGNASPRHAGLSPQKYRPQRVNIAEMSEHNPTDSAYTGTDLRGRSSPPPSYSSPSV
jgi:hypothetical protein